MKYKVKETYRSRSSPKDVLYQETGFESDSTDFFELAVEARIACHPPEIRDAELVSHVRKRLTYNNVLGQLTDQEITCFTYVLDCASGEWEIVVEAELTESSVS